jgi:hypothetical protein
MSILAYAFQSRLTAAQFDVCFRVLTRSCNATSKLKVLRHPGVCRSYGNTCLYANPIKSYQLLVQICVVYQSGCSCRRNAGFDSYVLLSLVFALNYVTMPFAHDCYRYSHECKRINC